MISKISNSKSVADLIATVLGAVFRQFYDGNIRAFKRDERALTKAIARYGHECHQRGWEFSEHDILRDMMNLLNQIKRTGADFGYLPVYLEGAVRRSIGLRSDELNSRAKALPPKVQAVVSNVRTAEVIVEPSVVQVCSAVFKEMCDQAARRKRAASGRPNVDQLALL